MTQNSNQSEISVRANNASRSPCLQTAAQERGRHILTQSKRDGSQSAPADAEGLTSYVRTQIVLTQSTCDPIEKYNT